MPEHVTEAEVLDDRDRHRAKRDKARRKITRWQRVLELQQKLIDRRNRQLEKLRAPKQPRIITAAQLGLRFSYPFGTKGTVVNGAGHYTAGGRSADAAALREEMRRDHAYHASLGWGGLSYEAMIADDGTIGLGNPTDRKSAAVANMNTGLVNICCPGTTGDRMTAAQKASVKWLLANWHTAKVPPAHRLARPAHGLTWKGHNQWPGQSTGCPGAMQADYDACW